MTFLLFTVPPECYAQRSSRAAKRTDVPGMKRGTKKERNNPSEGRDLLGLLRENPGAYGSLTVKNFRNGGPFPYSELFPWSSSRMDSARYYPGRGRRSAVTFAGESFSESIVSFSNGKFSRLYVSLFNSGDGDLTRSKVSFGNFQEKMEQVISRMFGKKAASGKQRLARNQSVHFSSWEKGPYRLNLVWSGERNEMGGPLYCYAELLPKNSPEGTLSVSSGSSSGSGEPQTRPAKKDPFASRSFDRKKSQPISAAGARKRELGKNVTKEGGKVLIPNIPMVDQGPKPYCVPAVLERVLSYYGSGLNQHVLAGLMKTKEGTSYTNMYDALKHASGKLNITVRRQCEFFRSAGELEAFLNKYNSLARKGKLQKLRVVKTGDFIDLERTILPAEPELAREALIQLRRKGFEKVFCEFVKEKIDAGIPVLWSVLMDFSPEKVRGKGGHLRLIIGYVPEDSFSSGGRSAKKLESIIFSDTWGPGHEAKLMAAEDAWAITTGLFYVSPDR
ncbi:MAG: hypothetical protein J6A21_05190 [Lentisphaeria bacterium]|nr:hypothetical protein [Lentisphaeria bacterium]